MKNSCLIIGGGPGMGLGIAKKFAAQGYDIGFVTRRTEVISVVEKELKAYDVNFYGYAVDITNFEALKHAIQNFIAANNSISILIYNAAGFGNGNGIVQSPSGLIEDLKVSVGGFLVAYQTAASAMEARQAGTILATGGGIANKPSFDYLSLGVGKTALEYVIKSIAPEFAKNKIHVGIVNIYGVIQEGTHFAPGKIADAFWELHNEPVGNFSVVKDYK